jgi:hypothetical protein
LTNQPKSQWFKSKCCAHIAADSLTAEGVHMEFKDRKVIYGVLCGSDQSVHFEYFEGISEHGILHGIPI